jgi:GntR family transcriptional repressor for pyruvate dehydrogenase complex
MKSATVGAASQRRNLSDQVVQYLMEHIRSNGLLSGERLPSEVRISADLKISRGIVREAYRSLGNAGILEISAGRSPRVGALRSTSFAPLLQHALATQQVSAEQVLDVREAIEVRAAAQAAEPHAPDDIERLTRAVRGMRRDRRNVDSFVQHDLSFHEGVGTATRNPLFVLIAGALREAMAASVRAGLESRSNEAEVQRAIESHQDVVEAIESGDPALAAASMGRHFDEARRALVRARSRNTNA